MKIPNGYCDLRVESVNGEMINAFIKREYNNFFIYCYVCLVNTSIDFFNTNNNV